MSYGVIRQEFEKYVQTLSSHFFIYFIYIRKFKVII
nr:MAG TPA: hypothetical protein [Caudoviricetes sp.]